MVKQRQSFDIRQEKRFSKKIGYGPIFFKSNDSYAKSQFEFVFPLMAVTLDTKNFHP